MRKQVEIVISNCIDCDPTLKENMSLITIGSKIIQEFEIILVKKLIPNAVLINICQIMIFRLYTVYNKHEMIKIGNQTTENSQALSQRLK